MFDKFKQLKQLRDLQKQMGEMKKEVDEGGVKVVVNGNMDIEQVEISEELDRAKIASQVKENINKAMKQMQKEVAQVMRGSGMDLGM